MRHRPSTQFIVAGALLGLLLLLGTLQWRWLGQISTDERERMLANVAGQVREFTQDFDRELTRAYFWLQVDRSGPPGVAAADSTGHFQRWFASAPEARLISAVYTVTLPQRTGGTGAPVLARYDVDADRLAPVDEVPTDLRPLMARLGALAGADSTTDQPKGTTPPSSSGPAPLQLDIPALLIPRPPVPVTVSAEGTIVFSQRERPWDYTVAVFDTAYIRETYLPALLEREFGPSDERSYRVAVTDLRTGDVVLCASGQSSSGDCTVTDPDVSREFFELRMREFNRFVIVDDRRGGRGGGRDGGREGDRDGGRESGPAAAGATGPDAAAEAARRAERGPVWRVDVKHRAGSLEAAVASTRRKNFLVSSSVLALLGASVALLVVSSGRARHLAAQQMEFVAGVSHELRTPLTVIRSAGENLADGVVGDPSQVKQYGALIAAEGRRLTEMVEQVMEFAGFESGRALDLRPVPVREVVDAAVAASQPLVTEHDVTLDVAVDANLPPVLANQPALARTLHNLISNAVKYGGADRWVGVSVARVGRDQLAFRVSDHGQGIPDEDLAHIFEPFFRGQPGIDGHVHGSGLGLSLVSRIVAQHNGRVQVETARGRGTTFTVLVPTARHAAATAQATTVSSPSLDAPAWKRGVSG
jgi:signal transduction histidine kinase